jgi:hypothetical protein
MERVQAELTRLDTLKTNKIVVDVFSRIMEEQAGLEQKHIQHLIRAAGRHSAQPIISPPCFAGFPSPAIASACALMSILGHPRDALFPLSLFGLLSPGDSQCSG